MCDDTPPEQQKGQTMHPLEIRTLIPNPYQINATLKNLLERIRPMFPDLDDNAIVVIALEALEYHLRGIVDGQR